MATEAVVERRSAGRRLADFFHGRPRLQVGTLLAGPVGWLVIGYLGSLAILLIAAFWTVSPVSGELQKSLSFENFETLFDEPVYRTIVFRTILIAALVTITDAILAFPIAMFLIPSRWDAVLLAFVLFRIFDIYKPYPCRRFEHLPGGFGVMADDYAAAGYACLTLHIIRLSVQHFA